MHIDLILVGATGGPPPWAHGDTHTYAATPAGVSAAIAGLAPSGPDSAVLLWGTGPPPSDDLLARLLEQPDDVWHAGLSMGMAGLPHLIDDVAATWMLNRDPDADIEATSWRLSLRACLVRRRAFDALGQLDDRFESLDAAGLDLGHRWINHGARLRHVPALVPTSPPDAPTISMADQLHFIDVRYGRKWMGWAAMVHGRHPLASFGAARAAIRTSRAADQHATIDHDLPATQAPHAADATGPITVLIPTVERYPFLRVVLEQLRLQTVPPAQIVVVDQTPLADRQPQLFADFADLPLEVITLDEPGQCSARNAGLERAIGEYVLFIDDDDEVPPELLANHLAALGERQLDVSSGVVHEPNGPELSPEFQRFRVSDTFPTNNSMVRKAALIGSGWFDLAFDRGDRADHDVGMRLYLSGARMAMDPKVEVIHHHAPSGGLRVHRAGAITYGAARSSITVRQPLSPTQLYLWRRYYTPEQVEKAIRLHLASGLFGTGSKAKRLARAVVQAVSLRRAKREMDQSRVAADRLLESNPRIPAPSADGSIQLNQGQESS